MRILLADRLSQGAKSFLCDFAYFVVSYRDALDGAVVAVTQCRWRKR